MVRKITTDKIELIGRRYGADLTLHKATVQDWTDIIAMRTVQKAAGLQPTESWSLFINGVKETGELTLDVIKRTFKITCGTKTVEGSYSLTPNKILFSQPVTITIDGGAESSITFDGLELQEGAAYANRKFVSTDANGTLVFALDADLVTADNISTYIPDPDVDAVTAFLNLKNNGTVSRYRITLMSAIPGAWRSNLLSLYSVFREYRIEAPRSSYALSITAACEDGGAKYYYWNCTNGLTPMTDPGRNPFTDAVFAYSGGSVSSGWTAPFTSNTNFTSFRTFIQQSTGFTIIKEKDIFWFRSIADSNDWFKCEPY
jgi:hypothetical protein